MSRMTEVLFVAGIACIGAANLVGVGMSGLAEQKTGHSYWPPAANVKLAREYRLNFGADRNYVYYGLLHFASIGLLVAAWFIAALLS
jgi:hypothetical protein